MLHSPDYYAILGVPRDASQEEIRRAYLDAARRLHPDRNVAPGETEIFLDVQQAYEVLSNPRERKAYDASLPPDTEQPSLPFLIETSYSRSLLVRQKEEQLIYALLNVQARKTDGPPPAPPLNICLVLDRSTSMKDAKMELLKAAAIQFLREARAEDVFSVVAFSDRAEVVIPASHQKERHKLEAQIRDIRPSGATELFQGLECGLNELKRGLGARHINHLILFTDGQTYGDEQACLDLASQAGEQGIGISVMGIGTDWNDSFLDQVAGRTGNTSRFIARPQEIQKFLAEKFRELTRILAEDVLLEFSLPDGVELRYAFRMQPEPAPLVFSEPCPDRSGTTPMHLGPILWDTPLGVLFEFVIRPGTLGAEVLCFLQGNLRIDMASRPVPLPLLRVHFEREMADAPDPSPPPPAILQALSRLTFYRMQEKARTEMKAGQVEKATLSLKNLARHLLSQGHQDLAQTVMLEAENIQRTRGFSLEGGKEIKYATRALLTR